MIIGVISDTHGRMRENALNELKGSDIIIHAGDIGSLEVLDALKNIAPVYAVKGNTDKGSWAGSLPLTQVVEAEGKFIYVIHDIGTMDLEPKAAGIDIVVYGHSHSPKKEERNGVLYFNPGSAGPKRFNLPICLGRIEIKDDSINAELVDLSDK
ncbi:MAG: metallophosphoesterase family protein [Clostridiaceae bacterium]|nr:metallophosphoesterase family protein [Clostridiaceae bacterium]